MSGKQDNGNGVTSTQQSLSSFHDPGWNDPPKSAFSTTQSSGSTHIKRLLNKRVAFRMNCGSAEISPNIDQPSPGLSANMPPPMKACNLTSAPHAPFSMPMGQVIESQPSNIDKNQALSETVENLEGIIRYQLEFSSKIEEVRRRLDTMKTMWKEDKLNDSICRKVLDISKALRRNDVEGADEIHVSLMLEHAAVCKTWIPGIRHMILELQEKTSRPFSNTALQESHLYLLPQSAKVDENT